MVDKMFFQYQSETFRADLRAPLVTNLQTFALITTPSIAVLILHVQNLPVTSFTDSRTRLEGLNKGHVAISKSIPATESLPNL